MHLPYILITAILTLSVHQVPVIASVGSDIALTGVMSLGFLHLLGADQSDIDQFRFLRGNNIAEDDKEERGLRDFFRNCLLNLCRQDGKDGIVFDTR
ncbi:Secreted RxLR effector peptide protein [Phytophthora palmivora]|uniref:RxLR effector protein n=1 Tax=Phytophthora palmivora TaxID=4796 RepID=A0A2P4YF40_9STRA|nr:Secreted RxLR effector peptide protein [Phytophthora palmivora]